MCTISESDALQVHNLPRKTKKQDEKKKKKKGIDQAGPHLSGSHACAFRHLVEGDWKRELHLGVGQLQWLPQRCGYDVFARRGDGEGLRSRVDDVPDAVLHGGRWGGRERGGGRRGGTKVVDDHRHDEIIGRNLNGN